MGEASATGHQFSPFANDQCHRTYKGNLRHEADFLAYEPLCPHSVTCARRDNHHDLQEPAPRICGIIFDSFAKSLVTKAEKGGTPYRVDKVRRVGRGYFVEGLPLTAAQLFMPS